MAANWEELEQEFANKQFKDYAPVGEYKVKIASVEIDSTPKGTDYVKFTAEDSDEYKFPQSATHWLSKDKVNWRRWHHKNLMVVLGAPEDKARQAIDKIDFDGATDAQLLVGYRKAYEGLVAKKPTVEVVVRLQYRPDGTVATSKKGTKLSEFEFKDSRVFIDNTPKSTEKSDKVEEVMGEVEEVEDGPEIPW